MTLISEVELDAFLGEHSGWSLENEQITRTYVFADFVESIGFVAGVAIEAEKADHHPDIDIRWNKVKLTLSTHSEGGLTEKDVVLAARCDTLFS